MGSVTLELPGRVWLLKWSHFPKKTKLVSSYTIHLLSKQLNDTLTLSKCIFKFSGLSIVAKIENLKN